MWSNLNFFKTSIRIFHKKKRFSVLWLFSEGCVLENGLLSHVYDEWGLISRIPLLRSAYTISGHGWTSRLWFLLQMSKINGLFCFLAWKNGTTRWEGNCLAEDVGPLTRVLLRHWPAIDYLQSPRPARVNFFPFILGKKRTCFRHRHSFHNFFVSFCPLHALPKNEIRCLKKITYRWKCEGEEAMKKE